jgi:hypothetical protein
MARNCFAASTARYSTSRISSIYSKRILFL